MLFCRFLLFVKLSLSLLYSAFLLPVYICHDPVLKIKHITSPLRDYRRQSIDCLLGLDRFVERRHFWLPKAKRRSSYVHTGQATVHLAVWTPERTHAEVAPAPSSSASDGRQYLLFHNRTFKVVYAPSFLNLTISRPLFH